MARVRPVTASATQSRIEIVGGRIDIDENRSCATISDAVGRCDERMAGRDHLIAGADTHRQQREMKRGRAVRDRAGMGCAHRGGKFPLKGSDLRALRYPARQHRLVSRLGFGLLEDRHCDRDHEAMASCSRCTTNECRSARHQSTRSRKPSSSGTLGLKAKQPLGLRRRCEAAGYRINRPLRRKLRTKPVPAHHRCKRLRQLQRDSFPCRWQH